MHARPAAELEELRARIERLETAGRPRTGVLPFGVASLDAALPQDALSLGALHEVAGGGEGAVDGAAAALFAAGIVARLRDIYIPDLHIDSIKPKTRDFR